MKLLIIKLFPEFILGLVLLSSCEKVVDVKLKNAEPRIVIEGLLSDQDTNQTVRISKTISFTEPDRFEGVESASVVLTNEIGQTINFNPVAAGVYKSSKFAGVPGEKYVLKVTVEGQVYTATSSMPEAVKLDSISFKKISFFGNDNIFPVAYYNDPEAVSNQYLFLVRFKEFEPHLLSEDRFNNGNNVIETLFFDSNDLAIGDTARIEMRGIDRNVYRYFFSIAQITGEGGPPVSPANPPSNFSNGALGVFSAYTSSTIIAVVGNR